MQENAFGKTSKLLLTAALREGETFLRDVDFTAPFKIMSPFKKDNGGIQVMLLAASAGIMEGDRQQLDIKLEQGTDLEFLSQAYEKIHQMKNGCARRSTRVYQAADSRFCFRPVPVIPFRDSAFENETRIYLEDETASCFMSEILSCGRSAMGERFLYRSYYNLTEIYRAGRLIYRDNARYVPGCMPMSQPGMYEGYTHLLNIFLTKKDDTEEQMLRIQEILDQFDRMESGVTRLGSGDLAVRALGFGAQRLEELSNMIQEI